MGGVRFSVSVAPFLVWVFGSLAHADDLVTLVASAAGKPAVELHGTIVDFTGQQLTLQTVVGQRTISAEKIAAVQTSYPSSYQEALELLREGHVTQAIPKLEQAIREEERVWVQRELLAKQAKTLANAGQIDAAGDLFLQIVKSDPDTIHIDAMPLAWSSLPPDIQRDQAARKWMEMPNLHAKLMGASWLLATSQRGEARQTLESIERTSFPKLALLATALLWQQELVSVDERTLERWQRQIESGILPRSACCGPWVVIAKGWYRLRQYERCALVAMRCPILFPENRTLAAESLLVAAKALEKNRQPIESKRLVTEIVHQYTQQPAYQQAALMLQQFNQTGGN